jgi:hypothetical protein
MRIKTMITVTATRNTVPAVSDFMATRQSG